jgi:hypothetical protein
MRLVEKRQMGMKMSKVILEQLLGPGLSASLPLRLGSATYSCVFIRLIMCGASSLKVMVKGA